MSEGVSKIECQGEIFDPLQHEALSTEETNEYESGVVTKVLRNGYKLRDRVIQPSRSRHNRTIKNLFQESGIPSWERCRLPYVYLGDDLVCIPGLAVENAYAASGAEIGLEINISGTQTSHLDWC